MKTGGLRELPTMRDALRRRKRVPIPIEQTSDAAYPAVAERRSTPRAPLHFQRIELKYFLPYRYLDHFVERISRRTDIDPYLVKEGLGHTRYPVTSLYFDSYDLAAWRERKTDSSSAGRSGSAPTRSSSPSRRRASSRSSADWM